MTLKTWSIGVAILGGMVFAVYALSLTLPIGIDFYYWYWPIPRAWLAGETQLYDAASRQFFSPPWALWMLLPFASLDIHWGMAALTLSSLAIIAGVSYASVRQTGARHPGLVAVLAVLCPYSLSPVFTGTLDAWSLLGVYLSYRAIQARRPWLLGAGLLLAVVRPQDAVLTVPLLLLGVRSWPRGDLVRTALLPALVLLASFVGFGWDWPVRWWQSYFALAPQPYLVTSTYAATNVSGIPLLLVIGMSLVLIGVVTAKVWRRGLTEDTLDLTVTANAVISPYMLSQSYVLLLAIPWARLAARRPLLAAIPYAISPVLLIRSQGLWDRLGLLDVTFPMILLVLLLLERRFTRRQAVLPNSRQDPVQPEPAGLSYPGNG